MILNNIILHKEAIALLRGLTIVSVLNYDSYRLQTIKEQAHTENQYLIFEDSVFLNYVIFCSLQYEDPIGHYDANEPPCKIRIFFKDIDLEYVNHENDAISISNNTNPKNFFTWLM